MLEKARQAKLKQQTREIHEAIGRFCVVYEHMVFAHQLGVEIMLQMKGLGDSKLPKAVTADLTAEPLRKMWHSVMLVCLDPTPFGRKVLSNVSKQAQKMIEVRNDTLHRVWFVGFGNEHTEDYSAAFTMKHRHSAKGVEDRSREQGAEELSAAIARMVEVTALINRVNGCAFLGTTLEENFHFEGGRLVEAASGHRDEAQDHV